MKADDEAHHARDNTSEVARGALDWPRAVGRVEDFMAVIAVRKRRRRQRRFQAAAVLVAVVGITSVAWQTNSSPTPPKPVAAIATASTSAILAMPVRQVLDDGSVVELKDDAEIAVAFTAGVRRVVLRRGEAHFEVAKDPARPFVVTAGGIEVRAVGTAFAVDYGARAVEVFVTEGRVAVAEDTARAGDSAVAAARGADANDGAKMAAAPALTGATPRRDNAATGRTLAMLEAGKRVIVEIAPSPQTARVESPRVFAVSTEEMGQRLAWRVPRLDLSRTRLAEAITLINRHSATSLVLGDEELGQLELSGVLRADNVEPLLRVLEQNYAIKAERSAGKIILRKTR